jgi:fibronectin type 3 domain-containing protein
VFTQAEVKDGKVVLAWDNSDNPDAARLELIRIEKDDRTNRPIMSWVPPSFGTAFNEPFLTLGKTYRYKLTVTDSAGNKSETFSRDIYYETGVRQSVAGLKFVVDRETKKIVLSWKNNQKAVKCMIYRSKNEGPFTLYHTLEGNIESFTDKGIIANNTYSYKVQLTYPKGIKSILSEEIIAKY